MRRTRRRQQKPKTDDMDYVEWVENTLIPDLRDSGRYETASDLERLCGIVRHYESELTNMAERME